MKKYISKIMLWFSALTFLYAIVQTFIFIEGNSLFDRYNPNNICLIIGIVAISFLFLGLYRIIDLLENKWGLCSRKSKLIKTETGKSYYLPSKRWIKLNKDVIQVLKEIVDYVVGLK